MSELVDKINKENMELHGPTCNRCNYFAQSCRCNTNNVWKNRELTNTLQKVITHAHNNGVLEGKMEAPVQVLGRELLEAIKNIEMSGLTVDEVLKQIHNNPYQYF